MKFQANREALASSRAIVLFTLILGLAYPLAVTAIAQVTMPDRASGQIVEQGGRPLGSKLIGQDTAADARYFQTRPSISRFSASASYFPNLGPNSAELKDQLAGYLNAYIEREGPCNPGLTAAKVPVDAVTDSGSGVDPAISPQNARLQAGRVAAERGIPLERVQQLIDEQTHASVPLLFDQDTVNVFELNLALDSQEGAQ